MDPLTVAEEIFSLLKNRNVYEKRILDQLTTREAKLNKNQLVKDLRTLKSLNDDLNENLSNLADWLDRDGFVPFIDAETGIAPR